ncbi:hypothetical protein [Paraburkholderia sp. GAS32]|uniref:hypothetical protein n=1 Tax=Paraburkholderia sp. GAS32 TaxID=3035129 RepID=UPI003D1CD8DB
MGPNSTLPLSGLRAPVASHGKAALYRTVALRQQGAEVSKTENGLRLIRMREGPWRTQFPDVLCAELISDALVKN